MRTDCTKLFKMAPGIRILRLTPEDSAHSNIYPETPVWLTDRRRFLITGDSGYMIASLDGDAPVTILPRVLPDGSRPTSVCISLDGAWFYHLRVQGTGLTSTSSLWRVNTETFAEEHIMDTPYFLDGYHPSRWYGIGTISSDGERFASSAFLGDGTYANAPAGLIVWDMPQEEVRLVAMDTAFGNAHLQYCRSRDPELSHDLLIQMNHGMQLAPDGTCTLSQEPLPTGLGVDIHVIRDDGTHWRDLPWGRDGIESCIGHQAWRSDTGACITVLLENADPTYGLAPDTRQHICEAWPVDTDRSAPHIGALNPDPKGRRRMLDEGFEDPRFCHFFCSEDGQHFVFDTFICEGEGSPRGDGPSPDGSPCIGQRIYRAEDDGRRLHFRYICNTYGKFLGEGSNHAHPILTPDNSAVLFNSTVSGRSQVYMAIDE